MRAFRFGVVGCIVVCAIAVGGCRDEAAPGTTMTTGASAPASRSVTPSAPASPAGPSTLSDGQVLDVVHTANMGEMAQAQLAQEKAVDSRVKELAAMMLRDHGAADTEGQSIASSESLTMMGSPTSTGIVQDGGRVLDLLRSKPDREFDVAYVDAQVSEHQAVLGIIDAQLTPSAMDGQVKAYLSGVRSKVAQHLAHAQKLQADLRR